MMLRVCNNVKKFYRFVKLKFLKGSSLQQSKALVAFDTNKFIHGSYHHQKYIDRYNMDYFLSIIRSNDFKEYKEFNEISNFFPISLELLTNEIINELEDNGFKDRLEIFFKDINISLQNIKNILPDINIETLEHYLNQAKRYVFSGEKDLSLAKANMVNFSIEYQSIEINIIQSLLFQLSAQVSINYQYAFGKNYIEENDSNQNITEQKIKTIFSYLFEMLMSKNITKKEIVKVFEILLSDAKYIRLHDNKEYFDCSYPHGINYTDFNQKSDYQFNVIQTMHSLDIESRFNKFLELYQEETKCYYIFNVLNTELHEKNEMTYGDISYYNENIYKSKGYRNRPSLNQKDQFSARGHEVKAILQHKTKRYFPNVSSLHARSVIETNISLLKLYGNRSLRENSEYFKPDISRMDVSYSHFILDEEFYMIGGSLTVYDGGFSYEINTIYPEFFDNITYSEKFHTFILHLNHKQKENLLTQIDLSIMQILEKFKKSVESITYTDVLLNTWNGFEFLARSFRTMDGKKLDNKQKVEKVIDFVELMYSFVYTNKHFQWNIDHEQQLKQEIKRRATRLVTYAYYYRNRAIHEHLIENPFMISVVRGLNILLANFLNVFIQKIIFNPDATVEEVFIQLKSDAERQAREISQRVRENSC